MFFSNFFVGFVEVFVMGDWGVLVLLYFVIMFLNRVDIIFNFVGIFFLKCFLSFVKLMLIVVDLGIIFFVVCIRYLFLLLFMRCVFIFCEKDWDVLFFVFSFILYLFFLWDNLCLSFFRVLVVEFIINFWLGCLFKFLYCLEVMYLLIWYCWILWFNCKW